MNQSMIAIAGLLLFSIPLYCPAQALLSPECDNAAGLTVGKIVMPRSLRNTPIPIETGKPFSREGFEDLAKKIHEASAKEEEAYRFRFELLRVDCSIDSNRVDVELGVDNLGIPWGESAGSVIDEASPNRLDRLRYRPNLAFRWNRDRRLGDTVGGAIEGWTHGKPDSPDEIDRTGVGFRAWKGVHNRFYSNEFRVENVTEDLSDPLNFHAIVNLRSWLDRLPFGPGELTSKGFLLGLGWEIQQGQNDFRVTLSYRLGYNRFDAVEESQKTKAQHTMEAGLVKENLIPGGFLRLGGSFDYGKASRLSGFSRFYWDFNLGERSSFAVDWSTVAGISGGVLPPFRRFVGGTHIEPFLGGKNYDPEEFTWKGPILRGYGASDFYVPRQFYRTTAGSYYGGFSVTIGLPGYFKPLLEAVDSGQEDLLREQIQRAYNEAIGGLVQRNIKHGVSGEKAKRRNVREALELRDALHNAMFHGHRFTLRPLLLFDAGVLTDHGYTRQAMNWGGGLRLQVIGQGIEVHFTRPFGDTLPGFRPTTQITVSLHTRMAL